MSYYIRLDDACEKRHQENWDRVEEILDRFQIKPLVGIIPHCEDSAMGIYCEDPAFWQRVKLWKKKGWALALHGYTHVCITDQGGLNPVNKRSEFAGVPLEKQKEKIRKGIAVLNKHGIEPKIFFAPSHTFDKNTLIALKECSDIRIISDTIANKPYSQCGFTFIPQQSGKVRNLPLDTVTFCYHPNTMKNTDFVELVNFLNANRIKFKDFPEEQISRNKNWYDKILNFLYFARR